MDLTFWVEISRIIFLAKSSFHPFFHETSMSLSFLLAPKVKPKVDAQGPKTKTLAKAPPEKCFFFDPWVGGFGIRQFQKMKGTLVTLIYPKLAFTQNHPLLVPCGGTFEKKWRVFHELYRFEINTNVAFHLYAKKK